LPEDEQRRAPRDSLFLLASLRIEDEESQHRVKIRNLSSTGLMAEGSVQVRPGQAVALDIRNIGWVNGKVAWVLAERFGVMLESEIDPRQARISV